MQQSLGYGILAYTPGSGEPWDDEAHFDGWYASRDFAEPIFEDAVRTNPRALVHLIVRIRSEWRDQS